MKSDKTLIRVLAALAALAGALTLAACGGDDETTTAAEETAVTADDAITEIAAVRDGLSAALAAYESGDAGAAEEAATDAYLEHFELVEGPLEEIDAELNEELEELIREELRAAITAGDAAAQVSALIDQAQSGLDKAESKLQGAAG